jgi:hypothetical protein
MEEIKIKNEDIPQTCSTAPSQNRDKVGKV